MTRSELTFMKVLLEHLIDECLTQNDEKHNHQRRAQQVEDSEVDVTIELSERALVNLATSTFWLLICLMKERVQIQQWKCHALLSLLIEQGRMLCTARSALTIGHDIRHVKYT
jgi:hypothetical protein